MVKRRRGIRHGARAGAHVGFERLVNRAVAGIPSPFREALAEVAIVIDDEPSDAQRRENDLAPGEMLYGLYEGVPRSALNADSVPVPSRITIYRGPCLRSAFTVDGVRDRVQDTVRHEIAHHFGISDARLHELAEEGLVTPLPPPPPRGDPDTFVTTVVELTPPGRALLNAS